MPVTLAPAQPMSAVVAQQVGAAEQFNKTLPVFASLYGQQQQRQSAERINMLNADLRAQEVGAEISSRESISRDALENRSMLERRHLEAQQEMQARQIDAHREAQFMDWAMKDAMVGQQEMLHFQRQQQGLAQITQMQKDGYLDKDDPVVIDAIAELKTGIDFTQRRMKQQQAKDMEAQAKLRDQQAARLTKSEQDATKYEADLIKAGYNTLTVRDGNGFPHILIKNNRTGEWYDPAKDSKAEKTQQDPQPLVSSAGEPLPFIAKDGHTFDYAAAHKDAKARAEADPDFMTVSQTGKRELNQKGHEWIQARLEGVEREFFEAQRRQTQQAQQQQPQQAAPQAAPQAVPQQAPQIPAPLQVVAQAIAANPKIGVEERAKANGLMSEFAQLAAKPTKDSIARMQEIRDQLRKLGQ